MASIVLLQFPGLRRFHFATRQRLLGGSGTSPRGDLKTRGGRPAACKRCRPVFQCNVQRSPRAAPTCFPAQSPYALTTSATAILDRRCSLQVPALPPKLRG